MSTLQPSSAFRRVVCPGSRALEARYPQEQSEGAREGELAALVAREYLLNPDVYGGHSTPRTITGEVIPREMIEGAELYRQAVNAVSPAGVIPYVRVEQPIAITSIHPDCRGTPDAWYFDRETKELYVWEYKFGHGYVDVFENWQLIEYAAGILESLDDTCVYVTFTIVQPRCYHRDGTVRRWRVGLPELETYFDVLRRAEATASQENAPCVPSTACSHCVGRHACEALQRTALSIVDMTKTNTPFELNSQQTGQELRTLHAAAKLLDARITGLEEQAIAMIKRGENVTNYGLESTEGRQKWTVPIDQVIALGAMYGKDLAKQPDVITPKQAIALKVPAAVVNKMSESPRGSMKLVPINASRIFGGRK